MLAVIGNVQFDPYRGCANTSDLLSTAFRVAAHGADGWMCALQMLLLVWVLVCSRPLGEAASPFASTFCLVCSVSGCRLGGSFFRLEL